MAEAAAFCPQVGILHYLVSYPDTDAGGVVNHGRYIDMAERARHHLLKSMGLPYATLSKDHDTQLMVHRINATYQSSAVFEDSLLLKTSISSCSAARTIWKTQICRGDAVLATVSAELAALNASTGAIKRHPDILLEKLVPFLESPSESTTAQAAARRSPKHRVPRPPLV